MYKSDTTIGILGGGQLGRMLIQAGLDFNLDIIVMDPDAHAPCQSIAAGFIQGAITDFQAVLDFGRKCQMVTIEIENVNTDALKQLVREGIDVFPQPEVIELIQDKRSQKAFFKERSIPSAPFVNISHPGEAKHHPEMFPAFFKLGQAGYDGRGVQRVISPADCDQLPNAPGLLEKLVNLQKEIAVIVARNKEGQVQSFPTVELVFHPDQNLLEYLTAPAHLSHDLDQSAQDLAHRVITELNMVGILAVEMFVDDTGSILVNELAPRPHNSGHHTIEANVTSQYHQHLRSILNWPLGSTEMRTRAAMVNLLGAPGHQGIAKYQGLEEVLALEGVHVHLYGKRLTRPFRKMGHATLTEAGPLSLEEKAALVRKYLKIIS